LIFENLILIFDTPEGLTTMVANKGLEKVIGLSTPEEKEKSLVPSGTGTWDF